MINYDGLHFCGRPDEVGNRNCKWNKRLLVYGFRNLLPGLSKDDLREAFRIAFDRWEAVCDIRASHISNADEIADIVIDTGRIDGPSGTLAYAGLPCSGRDERLNMVLDNAEAWILSDEPPVNRIDLIRVACHELGHILGISHIEAGNLMAPTYSRTVNKPMQGDIREAQARYGPPTQRPTPDPVPQPNNPTSLSVRWVTIKDGMPRLQVKTNEGWEYVPFVHEQ